jgi:hypothetical protein
MGKTSVFLIYNVQWIIIIGGVKDTPLDKVLLATHDNHVDLRIIDDML